MEDPLGNKADRGKHCHVDLCVFLECLCLLSWNQKTALRCRVAKQACDSRSLGNILHVSFIDSNLCRWTTTFDFYFSLRYVSFQFFEVARSPTTTHLCHFSVRSRSDIDDQFKEDIYVLLLDFFLCTYSQQQRIQSDFFPRVEVPLVRFLRIPVRGYLPCVSNVVLFALVENSDSDCPFDYVIPIETWRIVWQYNASGSFKNDLNSM